MWSVQKFHGLLSLQITECSTCHAACAQRFTDCPERMVQERGCLVSGRSRTFRKSGRLGGSLHDMTPDSSSGLLWSVTFLGRFSMFKYLGHLLQTLVSRTTASCAGSRSTRPAWPPASSRRRACCRPTRNRRRRPSACTRRRRPAPWRLPLGRCTCTPARCSSRSTRASCPRATPSPTGTHVNPSRYITCPAALCQGLHRRQLVFLATVWLKADMCYTVCWLGLHLDAR